MLGDIIGQLCVLWFLSSIFFSLFFIRILSLLFFSRPSFRAIVSAKVPFSPFPFMFLFVFVFYHVTV